MTLTRLARRIQLAASGPVVLGILLVILTSSLAVASDGEAGQPDEFLRYGVNVRSLGMGRAYVALADNASALYYNPAGLMRLDRKYSFYGSHFQPFYESNFSSASLAMSRPDRDATGLRGFFFGPKSAWGMSFVSLASDGYELRDADDNLIDDDFGLYQWAFMLGFARETAGTAGILHYGATFKVLRQGVSDITGRYSNSQGSFGLDIGAQLQMINPPLLKELTGVPIIGPFFQLKYLMPLRLGLSIRNVVSPSLGYGSESDKYPTALRLGAGYHLPDDWPVRNGRITLVGDLEWLYADIDRLIRFDRRIEVHDVPPGAGTYLGTEYRYQTSDLGFFGRFGLSHVYDDTRFSAGLGFSFELSDYDFQIDFAHGFHEELRDDQRISLSVRFGSERDAQYFYEDDIPDMRPRNRYLHVVTDYPEHMDLIRKVVDSLALMIDTTEIPGEEPDFRISSEADLENVERYRRLVQDVAWAQILAGRAFAAFQRFDTSTAMTLARKADEIFASWGQEKYTDGAFLDHGQTLLIMGLPDSAAGQLQRIQRHHPRSLYYLGLAYQDQGRHTEAASSFFEAAEMSRDLPGWSDLARIEMVRSLLQTERYDSVVAVASAITADYDGTIDSNYPRFRYFPDGNVADDALYLAGRAHLAAGRAERAIMAWTNICRLFSDLDYCRDEAFGRELESLIIDMIEESTD